MGAGDGQKSAVYLVGFVWFPCKGWLQDRREIALACNNASRMSWGLSCGAVGWLKRMIRAIGDVETEAFQWDSL